MLGFKLNYVSKRDPWKQRDDQVRATFMYGVISGIETINKGVPKFKIDKMYLISICSNFVQRVANGRPGNMGLLSDT